MTDLEVMSMYPMTIAAQREQIARDIEILERASEIFERLATVEQ